MFLFLLLDELFYSLAVVEDCTACQTGVWAVFDARMMRIDGTSVSHFLGEARLRSLFKSGAGLAKQ